MIQDYVALDLETTGLNPARDRILEIGALKIKNGVVTASYETLVDCEMTIPSHITSLTGISEEMLEEARSLGRAPKNQEALDALLDFCEDFPLLGHNILFDFSFVKRQAVNRGLDFAKEGIDTLGIARKFLTEIPSRSLEALCGHYGIHTEGHHRAVEDAKAAAILYGKLSEEFEERDRAAFLPKPLNYQVKKQGPITKFQKAYLIDLTKYHKIDLDVSIDSLTKNEASRMIDKILSTYGRIKR